ncbi:hypothetical protein EP073_12480 [Geovibrio thiophilus]|uniref:Citrate lyase ligase C-terminal domain-containing protein n=1 Tax=Geovibrio thiophilus TaxID=139438 RepID=A0A3R5Y8F4_9BACT|nr:hypothetical protein [Geovibrio thiophilus]QAR34190.1 hypothetical protein EP073_12480 [Geovibrio thiophilus]
MNEREMVEFYYNTVQDKQACFGFSLKRLMLALSGNRKKFVCLEDNRYLRKILNMLGLPAKSMKKGIEDAKYFFLLYQVMQKLAKKGVPCYFFGRTDSLDKEYYSDSAQERREKHLDFPTMSEDYDKYEKHFKEILGEKASKEYVDALKAITQVIKRGSLFGHEDMQSELVNIINGRRVVVDAVNNGEKTIHVYGRCGAFGYAVDDRNTVPSLLQRKLNQCSKPIKVINHGLWGADDNLILNNLIIESETYGERDIVVFYERAPLKEEVALLEKLGMYYFDCTKPFHDDERSRWCIYDYAGHMNAEGYDISTNYIFDMLEKTGYQAKDAPSDVLDIRHDFISDYLNEHTSGEFQRNLQMYVDGIKADFPLTENEKTIGSIVMNCNPFTLGHRYLIEYASKKVHRLYVFVLQEDRSFFKFDDRIVLVRKGTADLKNVLVIPSGEFMISALTFPEYFMKDYKKSIDFDATKDLHTFGNYIAKGLGIKIRFAGEEPIDVVTAEYNRSMQLLLPEMGVEFHEIPRKTVDGEQVVSASKVRALMAENKWEEIKNYVPETTYLFLVEKFKNKGVSL